MVSNDMFMSFQWDRPCRKALSARYFSKSVRSSVVICTVSDSYTHLLSSAHITSFSDYTSSADSILAMWTTAARSSTVSNALECLKLRLLMDVVTSSRECFEFFR